MMPTGRNLFTGKTITQTVAGTSTAVPVGDVDFLAIGVQVSAASGGGTCTVAVQWSFDGDVWSDALADPEDTVAVFNGTGMRVKRLQIKAPYWRLGAQISGGTNPQFTVSANVLVW